MKNSKHLTAIAHLTAQQHMKMHIKENNVHGVGGMMD